jgi:hypothetical protein
MQDPPLLVKEFSLGAAEMPVGMLAKPLELL